MWSVLDAVVTVIGAGLGSPGFRRPARHRVTRSWWLVAAAAAVAVVAAYVAVASSVPLRFALAFLTDDLLFLLGTLLAPFMLAAAAIGLTVAAALVRLAYLLVFGDDAARPWLAVTGVAALLNGAMLLSSYPSWWWVPMVVAGAAAVAIAIVPDAWRRTGALPVEAFPPPRV